MLACIWWRIYRNLRALMRLNLSIFNQFRIAGIVYIQSRVSPGDSRLGAD